MGGVSISVPTDKLSSYIKVKEGDDKDEYIIVRNSDFNPSLNIISLYGESESRTCKSSIKQSWTWLLNDNMKIYAKN